MDGSLSTGMSPVGKMVAGIVAGLAIAGGGVGYAVHEHNSAQALEAQNAQMTAQLYATHGQLDALAAKVNTLAANAEAAAKLPAAQPAATGTRTGATARRTGYDPRFKKLQTQLDAQGKAIDQTRSDLDSTRTDLVSARTELGGSIAKTHDELVVLQKRGERSYIEFDLSKTKQFKRTGPISISLRKANTKHQYADLQLMVDDRNLSQKHVNLYQPAMFYQPDSPQPIEIVINDISKDHIHGYVSAPKYRQSELAAMNAPADATSNPQADPNAQPAGRQKLTVPADDNNQ